MRRIVIVLSFALLVGCAGISFVLAEPGDATPSSPADSANPDKFDQEPIPFPIRTRTRRTVFAPKVVREAGFSQAETKRIADNCLWGLPKVQTGADVGPTRFVIRDGYVLEHSSEGRIPLWVCEHCTKAEISSSLPRTNPFKADPKLKPEERAELSDYRGSGFDRGHMAPNGNQTVSDHLRKETFFLSNIVPQVGKKFNQSIWADLEDQARKWTRTRGESWIVTGAMFYDEEEDNPSTADGVIEIEVIGDNEVEVPTHLFKIVVAKNGSGAWESIAFVMANADHDDDEGFESAIQSIDWIEQRTGFDFFPDAKAETGDPEIENKLEASKSALWN